MERKELVPGTMTEAAHTLKQHLRYDLQRLPTDVAHVEEKGKALRFRRDDNKTYAALMNLLYSGWLEKRPGLLGAGFFRIQRVIHGPWQHNIVA